MQVRSFAGVVGAVVVAGFCAAAGLAFAADMDPIKDRQALMKSVGGASKVLGGMLEGKEPYDAAKASEALMAATKAGTAFNADYDKLFPAASKEGDTTAAPSIWEKPDDFKKAAKALADDANAAIDATKKDEASFKAAAGKMFGNCKSCHETFRVKKG
jgi:cytochrome c556